jgi:predicted RNA-binding Zn ribbon-like protein
VVFAHDTEVALQTMAALVNTAHEDPDGLATVDDLDQFVTTWDYRGHRTHDRAELAAVHELRDVLARTWVAPVDEAVDDVNRLLVEHDARPQLVRHDEWPWHLHAHRSEAPLPARMAVEAAMAMVDVIRSDESSRLRTCSADDCDNVLVDLSRNRSRRYCEANCGNRIAVAKWRRRQREADGDSAR